MRLKYTYEKWSKAELDKLKEGARRFGKDYVKIAGFIKTKNRSQVDSRI